MKTQQKNQHRDNGSQESSVKIIEGPSTNIASTIWENPYGKAVVISAGAIGALYFSGVLLHALAFLRRGYNNFKNSGKP